MNGNDLTEYHSENKLQDSFWNAIRETLLVLCNSRWLVWINFKKDFSSKYVQTGMGLIWAVLTPIIPVSVYIFLGYLRVLKISGGMHYTVYIISGMTFWLFLSGGIKAGINAIQTDRNLILKVDIPVLVIVLSRFGHVLSDTIVRLFFLIVLFFFMDVKLKLSMLFIPLVFFPLLALSLGSGIILGIMNVVNRDVENITNIILTYGVWGSSVIFPMPEEGIIGILNSVNIFNHLIIGCREFLVLGEIQSWRQFGLSSAFSFITLLIAIKIQHSLQYKIRCFL